MFFGTALFFPPLKWLLATFVLPAPGQGPSEATMDTGKCKGQEKGAGCGDWWEVKIQYRRGLSGVGQLKEMRSAQSAQDVGML
jgi:hypothetical protein